MNTNDDFDDFTDRPKEPHQCWAYIDNKTRCSNEAILNDYHCHLHRMKPSPIYRYPDDGFMLPDLVDRDSILRAISKITERLAQGALDAKRAGRLLYACQLANSTLDGKLREQQLALKQAAAQQKPATKAPAAATPSKGRHSELSLTDCHPEPHEVADNCHSEPQAKNPRIPEPPKQPEPTNDHPEPLEIHAGRSPADRPFHPQAATRYNPGLAVPRMVADDPCSISRDRGHGCKSHLLAE